MHDAPVVRTREKPSSGPDHLERHGREGRTEDVRRWYNGYLFGGEVIYNPWSVLCFLDSREAALRPYWLSTSSNDLVRELLELYALELQPVFESLHSLYSAAGALIGTSVAECYAP